MDRHIFKIMRNAPSQILAVIARITLLMFMFGLLSQSAQACTLLKQRVAVTSTMAGSIPCQATGKDAGANAKCAPGNQIRTDDCSVQTPVAVSNERSPASPVPVALAVAQQPTFPVKPLLNIGLAAPPAVNPRPPIPLSILHCSFQI